MAVTYDNAAAQSISGDATLDYTVGSGSNRYLLVMCGARGNSGTSFMTGATYNGVSMTVVASGTTGALTTDRAMKIFELVAPSTGTNVIECLNTNLSHMRAVSAISFFDVDQTTPRSDNDVFTSTSATSSSVTLTSQSDELIADICYIRNGGAGTSGFAPDGAQTQRVIGTDNPTTGTFAIGISTKTAGSPSTITSWSWTNADPVVHFGVSINPAAATTGLGRLLSSSRSLLINP